MGVTGWPFGAGRGLAGGIVGRSKDRVAAGFQRLVEPAFGKQRTDECEICGDRPQGGRPSPVSRSWQ